MRLFLFFRVTVRASSALQLFVNPFSCFSLLRFFSKIPGHCGAWMITTMAITTLYKVKREEDWVLWGRDGERGGGREPVPFSSPACIWVSVGDLTVLSCHKAALLHGMKHCNKDRYTQQRSTSSWVPLFRTELYAVNSTRHWRMCLGHPVLGDMHVFNIWRMFSLMFGAF